MPSPASEIWPAGMYFAGYIIIDPSEGYTPKDGGGYFTTSDLDSNGERNGHRTLFDNTSMVDSDLKVYAMYDKCVFKITGNNSCNINFGDILPDGTVYNFTKDDVEYVYLTEGQLSDYEGLVSVGMDRAAALTESGFSRDSSGLRIYKFAVIFKNPEDGSYGYQGTQSYIFAVSTNYLDWKLI